MKPTWDNLTSRQKEEYGNGCGLTWWLLNVPDFVFTASCKQHDFNYERGGYIKDKVKADVDLFIAMWDDSYKYWHYAVSVLYFCGVFFNPISWVVFDYGKWKTIDEIIEADKKSKE